MIHEREKSTDNGRLFSDEFCRPLKIGRFMKRAQLFDWGLNMVDSDDEIAAAF